MKPGTEPKTEHLITGDGTKIPITHSTALYKPQMEDDYGSVLCWAKNKVGQQKIPCIFQIIPAGTLTTRNSLFE